MKVKCPSGEYRRPVTKIVVIHSAEGYDDDIIGGKNVE